MNIILKKCSLEDQDCLKELCDGVDRTYIANRLPYPYTKDDAVWWMQKEK